MSEFQYFLVSIARRAASEGNHRFKGCYTSQTENPKSCVNVHETVSFFVRLDWLVTYTALQRLYFWLDCSAGVFGSAGLGGWWFVRLDWLVGWLFLLILQAFFTLSDMFFFIWRFSLIFIVFSAFPGGGW